MPDAIVTQLTALYAALVATANAAWTIYKDWHDVGKLKVTVGFRSLVGNGTIEDNLLVWNITNVGKRSVLLTHAAGGFEKTSTDGKDRHFLINDPGLPKRLEPGDYHMTICRQFDFSGKVERLYAIDSLGRHFYAPQQDILQVQKTLEELRLEGINKSSIRTPH